MCPFGERAGRVAGGLSSLMGDEDASSGVAPGGRGPGDSEVGLGCGRPRDPAVLDTVPEGPAESGFQESVGESNVNDTDLNRMALS